MLVSNARITDRADGSPGTASVDAVCREPWQPGPFAVHDAAGHMLVNDGTDIRPIQDFLGHRTPGMTTLCAETSPKRLAAVRVR